MDFAGFGMKIKERRCVFGGKREKAEFAWKIDFFYSNKTQKRKV